MGTTENNIYHLKNELKLSLTCPGNNTIVYDIIYIELSFLKIGRFETSTYFNCL